jgi:citrate lyase subunit beta / citryl-CoA lyase
MLKVLCNSMPPIHRSYLFVPGSRPDRFDKALNSGAHAVIIDLEDGVAPAHKDSARSSVAQRLNPARQVVLRLNGVDTKWFQDDLALCAKPGVSGVMIPKAETPEDVRKVAKHVAKGIDILPQVESARGLANALEIAKCTGVRRLVFGALDFQLDLGITEETTELLYFRSQLVWVSRLAQIQPPIETPTTSIESTDLVRSDTMRARRLGFGGKLCIHPKQVPIVNECFQPTKDEVAWAKSVIEAASASVAGAIAVNGYMVDRPVILKAEQVLSDAGLRRR